MLLALLLLATIPALPNLLVTPAAAGQVTHFGNTGFPGSVNITFNAAGNDTSTNITLGANSVVTSAAFDVRGWPGQLGSSPDTIGIDVGDDGDLEWYFGGPGNGSFGHVTELANGWERVGLNLSNGYNTTYSLRLPLNATVTSATVNFSTLSELTLSGADVRDSYLHYPSPAWGNATYKDCNYGNATINPVGKTEWANWHIYRGVYWFNLSQLPAVTVLDANLSFWVDDVVNNANTGQPVTAQHSYTLRPLLKDWVEGLEVNIPVQQGPGVTWINAIDNVTGSDYAWASAGASGTSDRGAAVATVTDSPANLEQTWITFNSQSLTNLIQGWVNGSTSNQGLLFMGDESTSKPDGSMLKIAARGNSTHGPRLVVVFEGRDNVTAGLDLGDDGIWEWNHAGNLSNGTTTPDFSASLNSLLANATPTFTDSWGNEFVDIPLNVSGNATLVLGDIDVSYDWTPTVTTSPHGNLATEINQHLSNLTPDATGNVSIDINVTSGSAGIVELSNLLIVTGDRPPSIGSLILPPETFVPNGASYMVGLEVTSYQGLANLSWVALIPQIQDVANRPSLIHSLDNGTSWVNDPGGFVSNLSGQWQPLNADTGRMEWSIEVGWAWPPEQDVTWLAQVGTTDNLHTERFSSATTDHERRMEIDSFHLWDETSPTEGGPEVLTDEWVAGGDQLRVSGTVSFLDVSSHPRPGDMLVELENVSGNGTVDATGAFSIDTQAPAGDRYGGFTVSALIVGDLDATSPGASVRTFRVDATMPGMMLHSPTGTRVVPESQQLLNVSIAETSTASGLADETLQLRWWVEGLHDDGDGIPEVDEYATRPLLREGVSDYFHAHFEDYPNSQGQSVSLFIEGSDRAGNLLDGGGPGFEEDLHHYISLVPSPTTLANATLELPGGDVLVPAHAAWLNVTLHDENWIEDLERIVVDMRWGTELTWEQGVGFSSNNPEVQVESFTLTGVGEEVHLNISFSVTPLFDPGVSHGQFILRVTDSSGVQALDTGLGWEFNADIMLADYFISLADDPNHTALEDDGYVALEARLLISGRVRYSAADLAPPADSYLVFMEVPLDLPLLVQTDEDGHFSGTMDAHGSGLYRVTLQVAGGPGTVYPAPLALRLQVDGQPPAIIGSEPAFIPANATTLTLQFDLQEVGAGMPAGEIPVSCVIRRGLETVGEQVQGAATLQISGEVSRHLVNLSFPPLLAGDYLDCWLEVGDLAGNQLSGAGSAPNWPLSLPVVEVRPDLLASELTLFPDSPMFGRNTLVNITLVNIGNHSGEPFMVTLETLIQHEGRLTVSEVGRQQVLLLEGETTTTISFAWLPDWEGDLDLVVRVDADEALAERDENNTYSWTITVQGAPEGRGFFISQTALAIGGVALLLLFCIGMLFALRHRKEEDESDEWGEDMAEDEPAPAMQGTVQPDGYEYLEWPSDSEEWWYREDAQDPWAPWDEDG